MAVYEEPYMRQEETEVFELAVLSVVGDRDDQQDSYGFSLERDEGLVVICDGMGGHEGGKKASELAVATLLAVYAAKGHEVISGNRLIEAAKQADATIAGLKGEDGRVLKAGSTLVSVAVHQKNLLWCSVGDSRAYLWRNGEMVQLTQDHNYHTVLREKRNAGLMDDAEYQREKNRGEALISFLGIGNLSLIDYAETPLPLQKEDKLILMSDGLYKTVSDSEILRIVDNFSNIGEALQALEMKSKKNAKKCGELRDNLTVALIKIK